MGSAGVIIYFAASDSCCKYVELDYYDCYHYNSSGNAEEFLDARVNDDGAVMESGGLFIFSAHLTLFDRDASVELLLLATLTWCENAWSGTKEIRALIIPNRQQSSARCFTCIPKQALADEMWLSSSPCRRNENKARVPLVLLIPFGNHQRYGASSPSRFLSVQKCKKSSRAKPGNLDVEVIPK
ncbi:hypothetical protein RRG08_025036 [Elysia crispata]|uniref:Uncharacterized protein n=1 Tax=Elysia crispata TaxID=231223 RepID=A0AAE1ANN8_9GAST|nr:hypothetical protein RRG08_025036 [Elysia crispata]